MATPSFRGRLSTGRINIFMLLDHWWMNHIYRIYNAVPDETTMLFVFIQGLDSWSSICSPCYSWMQEFVAFHDDTHHTNQSVNVARFAVGDGYAVQTLIESVVYEATRKHPHVFGPKAKSIFKPVLGATIHPCPWLDLPTLTHTLPYYLWNVKSRCVMTTKNLPRRPQYIAISHTWGRWPESGKGTKVENVPWLVPENSRFQVQELPYLLQKIPFHVEFVWIDLLCIPQDSTHACFAIIRRQEIARQASIFAGAGMAIAWINDVSTWEPLRKAVRFLSLRCLETSRDNEIFARLLRKTRIDLDKVICHDYRLTLSGNLRRIAISRRL